MKWITKCMYTIHRILGTLLSVMFLVWFLSAFVMMYHGFPRVRERQLMLRQELLSEGQAINTLLPIDSVMAQIPSQEKVKSVSLKREKGRTVFNIATSESTYTLFADSACSSTDTVYDINRTVKTWCEAPVARVDTLTKLDQWIPFGSMKKHLPVYKFHFADEEKHQLYISSKTEEVIQFTDKDQRLWAWLGTIPHWVYFTWLRQDVKLWNQVVVWMSGIGCIMVIAGMWVAVDVWRKTHRGKKHRFSPYKKKWYHRHYVSGIFFGIFALTFAFSGMMSLEDVPSWISHPTLSVKPATIMQANAPLPTDIPLDYRVALASAPETKQMEWSNFREHPFYTMKGDNSWVSYIDAAGNEVQPLDLSRAEVTAAVQNVYEAAGLSQEVTIETEELDHFELHYRDMSRMYRGIPLLPVWKVTANDKDHSVYYVNPKTGSLRYVNTTARWEYWMYTALHRLRIPGLNSNVVLRKTLLWILLLGGTVVSLTGVVLGVNYILRKLRIKR